MADALYQLGAEHALVVHCQGLDELAPLGPAQIFEVTREGVQERTLDPIGLCNPFLCLFQVYFFFYLNFAVPLLYYT